MPTAIVIGQGIAGSCVAWQLTWSGFDVWLLDQERPITASKVAAGLITPWAGKNCRKLPDYDARFKTAAEFYRRIEQHAGRPFFSPTTSVRLFRTVADRDRILSQNAPEGIELINDAASGLPGFRMASARLDVRSFLEATRDFFSAQGRYVTARLNVNDDVEPIGNHVRVRYSGDSTEPDFLDGDLCCFCQGYQPEPNRWFPGHPDAPVRGEILTVQLNSTDYRETVHSSIWLAPRHAGSCSGEYLLGATYDRSNLSSGPTATGQTELLQGLREFCCENVTVLDHVSAVRAATRTRRPVVERHAACPQLAIVNGLGSRGSLLGPAAAVTLSELLASPVNVQPDKAVAGADPHRSESRRNLTQLAQRIVRRALARGFRNDVNLPAASERPLRAIDATAGNGFDTVFLSQCLKFSGQVLAIDLQQQAIESTRARLQAEGCENVNLLAGCHGNVLPNLASDGRLVRAVMFNLGYLPGGDKRLRTTVPTTISALQSATRLLDDSGILTVVAYRGHIGGPEEAAAVESLLQSFTPALGRLEIIPSDSQNLKSPVLFVFRRDA